MKPLNSCTHAVGSGGKLQGMLLYGAPIAAFEVADLFGQSRYLPLKDARTGK